MAAVFLHLCCHLLKNKQTNTELQYQGSQIVFSFSANPLTAFYVSSVGVKLQQTPQYRKSPQWSAWSGRKLIKSAWNCLNPMCYTTYKVQCDLTAEVNDRCILIQEHFFVWLMNYTYNYNLAFCTAPPALSLLPWEPFVSSSPSPLDPDPAPHIPLPQFTLEWQYTETTSLPSSC